MNNRFHAITAGIFWILFVLGGVLVFLRSVEVAIGLFIVVLGIHRLASEIRLREWGKEQRKLDATLRDIQAWLERDFRNLQELKEQTEARLFTLNKVRAERDKREDVHYRDLVQKMIEIDNKLNEIRRAFLTRRPRSGKARGKG